MLESCTGGSLRETRAMAVCSLMVPTGAAALSLVGHGGACHPQSSYTSSTSRRRELARRITACRAAENGDSSKAPYAEGADKSPVPWEQVPMNEFKSLQQSSFFSWPLESPWWYGLKLGGVGATTALLLGWPVAWLSLGEAEVNVPRCALAACGVGLVASILAALQLYLGWAHVGNRLLSATVEYEETGWYDGQVWIKPPQILARERLVGSYTVKPTVQRLKATLLCLAVLLSADLICFYAVVPATSGTSDGSSSDEASAMVSYTSSYDAESVELFEGPSSYCSGA